MDTTTQGAFRNAQFLGNDSVLLDFVVSFVDVIIQDQVTFCGRQEFEAAHQAIIFVTPVRDLDERYRAHVRCDFPASTGFQNKIASNSMKVTCGFADVAVSDLR